MSSCSELLESSHKEIAFELVLIGNDLIPKSFIIFLEGSPKHATPVLLTPVQAVTKPCPIQYQLLSRSALPVLHWQTGDTFGLNFHPVRGLDSLFR